MTLLSCSTSSPVSTPPSPEPTIQASSLNSGYVNVNLKVTVQTNSGQNVIVSGARFSFSSGPTSWSNNTIPVTTNEQGEAIVSLPHGTWIINGRFDLDAENAYVWKDLAYQIPGNSLIELDESNATHYGSVVEELEIIPPDIPTPTPKPITKATPEPQINLIPSDFWKPTGENKCRIYFARKTSFGENFFDWQSTKHFQLRESETGYIHAFQEEGGGANVIGMILPSLEPGKYFGDKSMLISDKENMSSIVYRWSEDLTEFSYADTATYSDIEILGNQDGYIWASFVGALGRNSSITVVAGQFTCVP